MNQYLMQLTEEARSAMYGTLGNLQWPAFAAVLLWATIKYPRPLKDKIILWVAFAVARYWGACMVPLLKGVAPAVFPSGNFGIAFGFVVLIVAAIAYFLRVSVWFVLEATVPAFILGRGLAITGCIFYGCCHGHPVSWGIYSAVAETCVFPTVMLDVATSCAIVIYLMILAKKRGYSADGTVAARGIFLFGILRVLIDLLRDNHTLFLLFTAEGLFGIAYIAAGILLLRAINIRGEKHEIT